MLRIKRFGATLVAALLAFVFMIGAAANADACTRASSEGHSWWGHTTRLVRVQHLADYIPEIAGIFTADEVDVQSSRGDLVASAQVTYRSAKKTVAVAFFEYRSPDQAARAARRLWPDNEPRLTDIVPGGNMAYWMPTEGQGLLIATQGRFVLTVTGSESATQEFWALNWPTDALR